MDPWLIFIIGTSCSGKSSFIRAINANDYICLDDAKPLYKFFKADELLISDQKEFQSFISANGIKSFYPTNKPHSIAVPSGGYRITNPAVWDYILQLTAAEVLQGKKYIIEFSRGVDPVYLQAFDIQSDEIYKRSIESIINHIPAEFVKKSLIINMYANFENRMNRNYQRRASGGHFVNENSMKTIYKTDIFAFDRLSKDTGFFYSNGSRIPVYSFENLESNDPQEIFLTNYKNALDFYQRTQNDR